MLRPIPRLVLLTLHVIVSAGWTGAVAVFLALALAGLAGDVTMMRSAGLAMNVAATWIIVPLSVASPATGLLLGGATRWGLFKHYWVLFKGLMTLPSTAVLMLHMGPISEIARTTTSQAAMDGVAGLRTQMAIDAALALVVLVIATVLATVKPRGETPFGWAA